MWRSTSERDTKWYFSDSELSWDKCSALWLRLSACDGAIGGTIINAGPARTGRSHFKLIRHWGGSVADLERFVEAQGPIYDQVRVELREGEKRSHWMWFVFPQMVGLGLSAMARRYGIVDRSHAAAYLGHPVLGPRLLECVALVNAHTERSAKAIFGFPDDLKLHSSLTLFHEVAPTESLFQQALHQFYSGRLDDATIKLLRPQPP